ncbi:MAG TPA: Ig-like domain-containing protein [Polyangiaceae bacterium]|jgi:hypothetical protein|nr:Ig-like domain-containing protein [Polyangiaceae bacterium]
MRAWVSLLLLGAALSTACGGDHVAVPSRSSAPLVGGDAAPIDAGVLATDAGSPIISSDTSLATSSGASTYGRTVTFTASVTAAQGVPDGTVSFFDATTLLGTTALDPSGKAAFSTALLGAGSHDVTAAYGGSAAYGASASPVVTKLVAQAGTTTLVTSSAAPVIVGTPLTFTAKVARLGAGAGVPTGTATFTDGTATLGTGTLDGAGVATLAGVVLAVGTHSVVAAYAGDVNFTASTAPALNQSVKQDGVTVALAAANNPSLYPASVAFTATVSAVGANSGDPTGTVDFKEGATPLGSAAVGADGVAKVVVGALGGGSHTVVASYGGDANHSGATGSLIEVVTPAPTTLALKTSLTPAVFGEGVTVTATVTFTGATPTGAVTFLDGTTSLGSAALGVAGEASLTFPALLVGARSLTATYAGDGNHAGTTSAALLETVNRASTTTKLVSSATPSIAGGPVTFTASVAPGAPGAGAPTGAVTFRDGATALGVASVNKAGVATFLTRTLGVATHVIAADYAGDTHFSSSTSATLSEVVNQDGATVSLVASANPSVFGAGLTFTAHVTSDGTGGLPTGTVVFKDGTDALATTTLDAGGSASFASATLSGGPHTISATYGGDTNHGGGVIGSVVESVDPAPTTLVVTASANPAVFGQSLTFTATAMTDPLAPFAGTVTFLDGTTALGTVTMGTNGVATLNVGSLAIATHSIQAVYGGDLSHAVATSAPLSEIIGAVPTTTAVAASSNPALVGRTVTFTATVSPVAPGAGVPTGMVMFLDGTTSLGGAILDASGVAALDTGALTEGTHSITVAYAGDGSYGASSSAALAEKLGVNVTTLMVVSTPNPSNFGASVTLTATVSGSLTTPTGAVTFLDGTTSLGKVALDASGAASLDTTSLAVGTHTLSASYAGDDANGAGSGTVSQVVGAAATRTTVTSNAATSVAGDRVTFTATVTSDVAGFKGDVAFFDGATSLGTATLSGKTASFRTATLTVGAHAITATYRGDASFAPSTSATYVQSVTAPVAPTTDGGAPHDAGVIALPDAGTSPAVDAGTKARGGLAGASGDGGCGCRMTRRPSPFPAEAEMLAGLVVLALGRRFRNGAARSRRGPAPSRRPSAG